MQRRISLIHATPLAIEPVRASFTRLWPQARVTNLLEDSLSDDLSASGQLTAGLEARFVALGRYAVLTGAEAILFTCSAFGAAIDASKKATGIPTLKPNEAMFEES